jgi:hypothetical protein
MDLPTPRRLPTRFVSPVTRGVTAQIAELIGMLGAVASALEDSGIEGLTAEERALVDAVLRDALRTVTVIGAMLETCSAGPAANG